MKNVKIKIKAVMKYIKKIKKLLISYLLKNNEINFHIQKFKKIDLIL